MKAIYVFDNSGTSADRYTVVIDKSIYTMSDNPNHPQGINQYSHDLEPEETYNPDESEWLVDYESLPCAVQTAIKERIETN